MSQPPRKNRAKNKNLDKPGTSECRAGRFTVSLSRTAVTMLCLVLAIAVIWAFFMGFMVGRGQNPAQRMEQMTAILDREKPAPAERPVAAQEAPPQRAENADKQASEPAGQQGQNSTPATAETKAAPAGPKVFDPLSHPEGTALAAWGKSKTGGEAGSEGAKSGEKVPVLTKTEPQFNWVFQMAAFRDKADADRARTRLENAGYRVSQSRNGKVTLVLVRLRGSEADAARLREDARKLKMGAPLLQSRQPVTAGKTGR